MVGGANGAGGVNGAAGANGATATVGTVGCAGDATLPSGKTVQDGPGVDDDADPSANPALAPMANAACWAACCSNIKACCCCWYCVAAAADANTVACALRLSSCAACCACCAATAACCCSVCWSAWWYWPRPAAADTIWLSIVGPFITGGVPGTATCAAAPRLCNGGAAASTAAAACNVSASVMGAITAARAHRWRVAGAALGALWERAHTVGRGARISSLRYHVAVMRSISHHLSHVNESGIYHI